MGLVIQCVNHAYWRLYVSIHHDDEKKKGLGCEVSRHYRVCHETAPSHSVHIMAHLLTIQVVLESVEGLHRAGSRCHVTSTVDGLEGEALELDLHTTDLVLCVPLTPRLDDLETEVPDHELGFLGRTNSIIITRDNSHAELAVGAGDQLLVDGHHSGDLIVVVPVNVSAFLPRTSLRSIGMKSLLDILSVEVVGGPGLRALIVVREVRVGVTELSNGALSGEGHILESTLDLGGKLGHADVGKEVATLGEASAVSGVADGEVKSIRVEAVGVLGELALHLRACSGANRGRVGGRCVGVGAATSSNVLIPLRARNELAVCVGGELTEVTVRHVSKRVADEETAEIGELRSLLNDLESKSREVVTTVGLRSEVEVGVVVLRELGEEATDEGEVVGGSEIVTEEGPAIVVA